MKIGLVLSGGCAKGAYQAGFLKAIQEENNLNIAAVSASSIGITSGYALSANKVDKLLDMWRSVHFDTFADYAYNVCFKGYLKKLVYNFIDEKDKLAIPLYAPIVYLPFLHMDYCRMRGVYNKKWRPFVWGAMSFPVVEGGVHFFRGQISVDGGAMDNIPIKPLILHEDVDLIMVLHFVPEFRPRKIYLDSGIPIIDYEISIHNMFRKRSFDFHHDTLSSMLDSGYEYGKMICGSLFNGGKNSLEEALAVAEEHKIKEYEVRMANVSLDTWVQRLNSICYPFVLYKGKKLYEVKKKEKKHAVLDKIADAAFIGEADTEQDKNT